MNPEAPQTSRLRRRQFLKLTALAAASSPLILSAATTKGANDTSTPAYWMYSHSILGDVVVVSNTGDKTVQPDNGLNGWNLSWADWKAGSAA